MNLNLSALAVRERSITLFMIIAMTFAGAFAFMKLGRAEDPSFSIKVMTVVSAWPGATAQEMQDQVAEPLEKRMQELKWYDRSETFTRPGLAFTTLTLKDQIPAKELQEQFYQTRKKMADEAPNLPRGVLGPFVNDEYGDVTFALYALKAKGEPQRLLVRQAETLRQRLLHVPGVKKVQIIGEQPQKIFVEFSQARLATLGVSPRDLFAALNDRNLVTPAGAIETKGPQVQIRMSGWPRRTVWPASTRRSTTLPPTRKPRSLWTRAVTMPVNRRSPLAAGLAVATRTRGGAVRGSSASALPPQAARGARPPKSRATARVRDDMA